MDRIEKQLKEQLEECRTFFRVVQLPLSLVQSALTLSVLVPSFTPQTRIHHFYLWVTICLACVLAWMTVIVAVFAFNVLHKMSIPSHTSFWLIRILHTLWLLWLAVAVILATTPTRCQNISYCAQHRAVIVFSFLNWILLLLGTSNLRGTINFAPIGRTYIPGTDGHVPGKENRLPNVPTNGGESQGSNKSTDRTMEQGSKESPEKHMETKFVDLEKGADV